MIQLIRSAGELGHIYRLGLKIKVSGPKNGVSEV
jgi:hypothetical protein